MMENLLLWHKVAIGAGLLTVPVVIAILKKVLDKLPPDVKPRVAHSRSLSNAQLTPWIDELKTKEDAYGVLMYLTDEKSQSDGFRQIYSSVLNQVRGIKPKQDAVLFCSLSKKDNKLLSVRILTFDEIESDFNKFLEEHDFWSKQYLVFGR